MLFLLSILSCSESVTVSMSTGHLEDGIYTNKYLGLCIEPEIYASIYSFDADSNKLQEFDSKALKESSEPIIPIVCLKDLVELRISLANTDIFGDFRNDLSIDYFKSTVSAFHAAKNESCKIELIESNQINIDGKKFLSNHYHLNLDEKHIFERQLFTYIEDRYVLFHLSDSEKIKQAEVVNLFKTIKFNCT